RLLSIPISAPSTMIGDTISASGGIQLATALGALQHHILPPSANQEENQDCPVDCIPNIARKKAIDNALVISTGFGGYSGACIISSYSR
ncbi:MAG: beta-ketoacyl-[acyl-carrier-protein] synthase II, partial [Desulfobacterales bacterium]|nr:beta-ketoacyl-[acyl-carrier-protein] synthase II [Desulfobacterales bacterium]